MSWPPSNRVKRVGQMGPRRPVRPTNLNWRPGSVHKKQEQDQQVQVQYFSGPSCLMCKSSIEPNRAHCYQPISKTCTDIESFKCLCCNYKGTRGRLQRHIRSDHHNEVFECFLCYEFFNTQAAFDLHVDGHYTKCPLCPFKSRHKFETYRHRVLNHQKETADATDFEMKSDQQTTICKYCAMLFTCYHLQASYSNALQWHINNRDCTAIKECPHCLAVVPIVCEHFCPYTTAVTKMTHIVPTLIQVFKELRRFTALDDMNQLGKLEQLGQLKQSTKFIVMPVELLIIVAEYTISRGPFYINCIGCNLVIHTLDSQRHYDLAIMAKEFDDKNSSANVNTSSNAISWADVSANGNASANASKDDSVAIPACTNVPVKCPICLVYTSSINYHKQVSCAVVKCLYCQDVVNNHYMPWHLYEDAKVESKYVTICPEFEIPCTKYDEKSLKGDDFQFKCGALIKRKDMQNHIDNWHPTPCPNSYCTKRLYKNEIEKHEAECLYARISPPECNCSEFIYRYAIQDHRLECRVAAFTRQRQKELIERQTTMHTSVNELLGALTAAQSSDDRKDIKDNLLLAEELTKSLVYFIKELSVPGRTDFPDDESSDIKSAARRTTAVVLTRDSDTEDDDS